VVFVIKNVSYAYTNFAAEVEMAEKHTRGEIHGCIVCGKPYDVYVVYNAQGKFIDMKVMGDGGRAVAHPSRPLVACVSHPQPSVDAAIKRVYGRRTDEDED
jgi:hypothetical protein